LSVSAGSLAPGGPKWYSLNWTVPDDAPTGQYHYSVSIYIGEKNITWTRDVVDLPTKAEKVKEEEKVVTSCQ
jgi:hypothetical protein